MKSTKKIACHQILLPDGSSQTLSVVEIQSGVVKHLHHLNGEEPSTEWLTGSVRIEYDEQGLLRAFYQGKMLK